MVNLKWFIEKGKCFILAVSKEIHDQWWEKYWLFINIWNSSVEEDLFIFFLKFNPKFFNNIRVYWHPIRSEKMFVPDHERNYHFIWRGKTAVTISVFSLEILVSVLEQLITDIIFDRKWINSLWPSISKEIRLQLGNWEAIEKKKFYCSSLKPPHEINLLLDGCW
jgi:hypothetical protein